MASPFWSSPGPLLAGCCGHASGGVGVWNLAGAREDVATADAVNTLQWSANNKVLAFGGDGSVALHRWAGLGCTRAGACPACMQSLELSPCVGHRAGSHEPPWTPTPSLNSPTAKASTWAACPWTP